MSRMRIILVTGMPGAGKEELLTVARGMGLPFLRMGDLVREGYASSGAEARGMTVGQYANSEREEHGRGIWALRASERMEGNVFLVDGCRSMDEVRAYRGLGQDIVVLAVLASPSQRYDRLVARARDDAPRSIEEFEARDARETGWGLADLIARADAYVVNDRDLETFRLRALEALEALL